MLKHCPWAFDPEVYLVVNMWAEYVRSGAVPFPSMGTQLYQQPVWVVECFSACDLGADKAQKDVDRKTK